MKASAVCVFLLILGAPSVLAGLSLDDLQFRHGIAFFHDLKYPADFTHLEYVNPDAPKGGTLTLATQTAFDTLAPLPARGIGPPQGFWFSADTLIVRAGDEVTAFYGRLADGIAVTDDRLAMVFRIHPQARWSDGVPITSRDVAYTFEQRLAAIEGESWFGFIESIEVIDPRHVAIHLKTPLTLHNIIIVQFTSILPEHYWRDRDPTVNTLTPPVSSGPYRIAEVSRGRYVVWQRDENYWGRDIPVNKGRYNFDTVRYDVYRDATVAREAFRKGLIDIFTETDVRYWHDAYDIPALRKGWIKKIRRHFGVEVGVRSLISLNNRQPRFADRRVREALTLAMDFEWQNQTLHHGYHKRAHSYWPDTILTASGMPRADELALLEPFRDELPPALFERPFRFPETTDELTRRRHLMRARDLLAEAGWQITDGWLSRDGQTFDIEFLSINQADSRVLLPYFDSLRRLGIRASIRLAETTQYINRIRGHDFDAILRGQDILMPPVIELHSTYHSESAASGVSRNVAGVAHPAIDALVVAANLATTLDEMIATCRALDRILLWQYYQIPLYAVDLRRTVHWDRFGRPAIEGEYWPAFPDGWWFDAAKAGRIEE